MIRWNNVGVCQITTCNLNIFDENHSNMLGVLKMGRDGRVDKKNTRMDSNENKRCVCAICTVPKNGRTETGRNYQVQLVSLSQFLSFSLTFRSLSSLSTTSFEH